MRTAETTLRYVTVIRQWLDRLAWCQYTVTGLDRKFDLQLGGGGGGAGAGGGGGIARW